MIKLCSSSEVILCFLEVRALWDNYKAFLFNGGILILDHWKRNGNINRCVAGDFNPGFIFRNLFHETRNKEDHFSLPIALSLLFSSCNSALMDLPLDLSSCVFLTDLYYNTMCLIHNMFPSFSCKFRNYRE